MFRDRAEAGMILAQRLMAYKDQRPVVVALPRGGVPVAFEIARELEAPLDIIMVRKLGYPGQPELAIGALAGSDPVETVIDSSYNADRLPPGYIDQEIAAKTWELKEMEKKFLGKRAPVKRNGRVVIAVDDGIATGATMVAVIRRIRRDAPRKIVAAAPVAAIDIVEALRSEADEVVTVQTPVFFKSVSRFYQKFDPVPDADVKALLDLAPQFIKTPDA